MGKIPTNIAMILDEAFDRALRAGGLASGALGQSFSGILNEAILSTPQSAIPAAPNTALGVDYWSATPLANFDHVSGRSVALNDGRAMIIGGLDTFSRVTGHGNCEIYDPVANAWSTAASLPVLGAYLNATVIKNGPNTGKVFVFGGYQDNSNAPSLGLSNIAFDGNARFLSRGWAKPEYFNNECWIYDPVANTWMATGSMPVAEQIGIGSGQKNARVMYRSKVAPTTVSGADANGGVMYYPRVSNNNLPIQVAHIVSGLNTPLSVSVPVTAVNVTSFTSTSVTLTSAAGISVGDVFVQGTSNTVSRQVTSISTNTLNFAYSVTTGNFFNGAANVVSTKNITVNLATDGSGNPTISRATDVVRAVKTNPYANALVLSQATGHGRGLAAASALGPIRSAIRVKQVVSGISTSFAISVSGNDITVTVATDGSGKATTTAAALATAVSADVSAGALVSAFPVGLGSYSKGSGAGLNLAKDSTASPATWISGGSGADASGFLVLYPCSGLQVDSGFGRYILPTTYHTLKDGRVVTAGVADAWGAVEYPEAASADNATTHCFIYDPVAETWAVAGDMSFPRGQHSSTLLNDGRVLVTGGTPPCSGGNSIYYLAGTSSAQETGTAASMGTAADQINNIRVTGLANLSSSDVGRFINISGAASAANNGLFQIKVFNSSSSIDVENAIGVASDANNGSISWSVYFPGTVNSDPPQVEGSLSLPTAEVLDPVALTWSSVPNMPAPGASESQVSKTPITTNQSAARFLHSSVTLPDGRALIIGGYGTTGWLEAFPDFPVTIVSVTNNPTGGGVTAVLSSVSGIVANAAMQLYQGSQYSGQIISVNAATNTIVTGVQAALPTFVPGAANITCQGGPNQAGLRQSQPRRSCVVFEPSTNTWDPYINSLDLPVNSSFGNAINVSCTPSLSSPVSSGVLFFGGAGGTVQDATNQLNSFFPGVYMFDTIKNVWIRAADMPLDKHTNNVNIVSVISPTVLQLTTVDGIVVNSAGLGDVITQGNVTAQIVARNYAANQITVGSTQHFVPGAAVVSGANLGGADFLQFPILAGASRKDNAIQLANGMIMFMGGTTTKSTQTGQGITGINASQTVLFGVASTDGWQVGQSAISRSTTVIGPEIVAIDRINRTVTFSPAFTQTLGVGNSFTVTFNNIGRRQALLYVPPRPVNQSATILPST